MKFQCIHPAARLILTLLVGLSSPGTASDAQAQQPYRNIVNTRFRTVSNGPQSAWIVDVQDPNDTAGVRRAALQQAAAQAQARNAALTQELAFLRHYGLLKPGQPLVLADAVIVRHNGQLQIPKAGNGPGRALPELTFNIVTNGDGAFDAASAATVQGIVNLLYPELKRVLGQPGWNGTVNVVNKDPRLGKNDEALGALLILNGQNVEIDFPTFTTYETQFLAMAQVMAQAFHARQRIAYDSWEQGIARAAAVVSARDLQAQITAAGQTVNPNNGFFYTPNYDLLNQPPLGNNTFTPPTKSNQPVQSATLEGMLIPRMQMASTAWLKVYIENPSAFASFNAGYYAAYAQDATVANDVNRLRTLMAAPTPTVEMLPFSDWYERQYVLDTSITAGRKLYAYSQPTFPSSATSGDNGAAVFLVYYDTTTTGDEQDASGSANVVYWDYNYQNRLFLPSFEKVTITNGFGTVAPFFVNIGGTPPNKDQMRVEMDFPVGREYVRVPFPAGLTGTPTMPNDFSGVMVGADTGALSVAFEGGSGPVATSVVQGAFGGLGPSGSVPNGFSRTRIVFTPTGGTPITYQRNTAFNNAFSAAPIFVLTAPGPTNTLTHTFLQGPQMISLPLRPLTSDLAKVLGTDPNATLLAQYRQDISGSDKYQRYPSLPLYQPGYALWSNFTLPLNNATAKGERTDIQNDISVALQYGWNMIGSPYNITTGLSLTNDLQVQYLGGDVLSLADAVSRGWIAQGVIAYTTGGYQDITSNAVTGVPQNRLISWAGYWIRVLVTEGVTLTYSNPSYTSRAARLPTRSRASQPDPAHEPGGWRVPLWVSDAHGSRTSALFGQSPRGADTFNPALSVASPPPFTRAASLAIRFPHPDWSAEAGGQGGDLLTDIRRSATRAQWEVTVSVPEPDQTYTLAWSDTAALPRGTRLTLIDAETGVRQVMNSASSVSFHVGPNKTTRAFQILAEPHGAGLLRISNVAAIQPPQRNGRASATMTLTYELSTGASTTVEIRRGGLLVRRMAQGRAAAAGVNQMVWDTKDDQGRALPAGLYTMEITAQTSEGERSRAIAPLPLTR